MNGADRLLLEDIFRQTGADPRVAPPAWEEWLGEVVARLAEALARRLGLLDLPPLVAPVAGWLIVALLAAAAALLLARVVSARMAARDVPSDRRLPRPAARTSPRTARLDWRLEAERRLAKGDTQAALEAAWWWLATAALGAAANPCLTTREVLARAGREDLAGIGARLDHCLYAPRGRHPDALSELFSGLRAALP